MRRIEPGISMLALATVLNSLVDPYGVRGAVVGERSELIEARHGEQGGVG